MGLRRGERCCCQSGIQTAERADGILWGERSRSKLGVINACEEGKAQSEAAASIAITLCQDLETLQGGDDVFYQRAGASKGLICFLVVLCQRVFFAFPTGEVCFRVGFL